MLVDEKCAANTRNVFIVVFRLTIVAGSSEQASIEFMNFMAAMSFNPLN